MPNDEAVILSVAAHGLVQWHGRTWAMDIAAVDSALGVIAGVDADKHSVPVAPEGPAMRRTSTGKYVYEDDKPYEIVNGVALLAIDGPMTRKPTSMSSYFGGTSTVLLRQELREARRDPDVKSAVLVIDSPGGSVAGTNELGEEIAAFAGEKPIVGYIPDLCASAALWAAAQCSMVIAGPAGWIGSIGVYGSVIDKSRAYENEGYRVHVISSGGVKGAGVPGTPVTDEQIAEMKREVGIMTGMFVSAVASGRRMDEGDVRKLATGQIFDARDALSKGLIDAIMPLDDVMACLQSGEWPDDITERMAGSSGREEPFMASLFAGLVAQFKSAAKTDEQKAAAAQLEAEAAANEKLASDNEALRKQVADLLAIGGDAAKDKAKTEAQNFALGLCAEGRITAAETADVIANYLQAKADDEKDGGTRLAALTARENKRPANKLQAELVPDPKSSASAEETDTEKTVRILLTREATAGADNRGDHQGLDAADTEGHKLLHKGMSKADRDAHVARVNAQQGRN